MAHNFFTYTEPKLYRDKLNKKWCIRYNITYPGQETDYRKEYGKLYHLQRKSLNGIADLTIREREFEKIRRAIELDLEAGIDKGKPEVLIEIQQAAIKEATKFSYDECLKLFMQLKGYDNPKPKQEHSAVVMKAFFENQFGEYVRSKGLDSNVSQITKSHIMEYLDIKFLAKEWNVTTYNNKKGILYGFFDTMKQRERIAVNPVEGIKNISAKTNKSAANRFDVFTEEERKLVWDWLYENNRFSYIISKVLYYSFIREAELSRLRVGDFLLDSKKIIIRPDDSKTGTQIEWVWIAPQLETALKEYLQDFKDQPELFMFSKSYSPGKVRILQHWNDKGLSTCLKVLRKKHPKLFKANLSLYSFKHTGVTDFWNANKNSRTSAALMNRLMEQCRHKDFATTQGYLRDLKIDLNERDKDDFNYTD